MNITVIGTGSVGSTLAQKWAETGHQVTYGIREINERVEARLAEANGRITAHPIPDAIQTANTVLLAIPGNAMDDFLAEHGTLLSDKIVIDATNKMGADLFHDVNAIHAAAPTAQVVRAFNTLGWENFANPVFDGERASLFYCADPAAQEPAAQLISDIGLEPVYLGDTSNIDVVDGLTRVWFTLAFQQKFGRRVALRLLHEPA